MARKISLAVSVGVYFANNKEAEAALVQPLGRSSTYVWTTYYETPGYASPANSGKRGAEGKAVEVEKQDQNVRTQHDD